MQPATAPTSFLEASTPILAYVVDATNVGCVVRPIGHPTTSRASYSSEIQQHGVVIRTCHVVVVEPRDGSFEVTWRAGTIGTVERIADGKITVNLGYRTLTILYRDARPENEQRSAALAPGDRVLLTGSPIERAYIADIVRDGELTHPERLRVHVQLALAERAAR
jgi:preprotein translocase subunit YajC